MSGLVFDGTFCVLCEKEFGPDLRRCCTADSVVGFRGRGKSRSYFALDGMPQTTTDIAALAGTERIKKQEGRIENPTHKYYASEARSSPPTAPHRRDASLLSFEGRIGRWQFLKIQVALSLPSIGILGLLENMEGIELVLPAVLLLPVAWLNAACYVKRLHDMNRSGIGFLAFFTGVGGLLLLLIALIAEGT